MVDSTDPPTPPRADHDAARAPSVAHSFRTQLTPGADVVDPVTWAGSVPYATGIAPRMRISHSKWFNLLWLLPLGFVVLIAAVTAAQHLRGLPSVQVFIEQHPGVSEVSPGETSTLPAWLGAQHFLNLFLMVFIIRSGVQILTDHPRLYWTRHSTRCCHCRAPSRGGYPGLWCPQFSFVSAFPSNPGIGLDSSASENGTASDVSANFRVDAVVQVPQDLR